MNKMHIKIKGKAPIIVRRSSSTSSSSLNPSIGLLQSDSKQQIQSTFFKTFSDMPELQLFHYSFFFFNRTKFTLNASRIPSPKSRLNVQLIHNQNQFRVIVSQSQEKQQEAIKEAINQKRNLKPKILQKLKRREVSPQKQVEMKPSIKVFQLPKLDQQNEKPLDVPPVPTFYCEAQRLIRDIRTFKPSFVEGAALSIYNDSLYLYGGIGGAGVRTNISKYDMKHQIWQILNATGDIPKQGRSGLTVVNYKNRLLYFGGSGMFNSKLKIRECSNNLYEFNLASCVWTKIYPQGDYIEPRRHHKACVIGSKWMLIYGGINSNEEVLSDTAVYNIEKQIWKSYEFQSSRLCSHAIINITPFTKYPESTSENLPNEQIFCIGGKDEHGISVNTVKKLIYCGSTNLPNGWEVLQTHGQGPQPCHNHTLEFIKRIQGIVLIGGMRDMRIDGTLESPDLFVFYPHINLWQKVTLEGFKNPRQAHSSCMQGLYKIILFGGIGNDKYIEPDVCIIDTDSIQVQSKILKDRLQKKNLSIASESLNQDSSKINLFSDTFSIKKRASIIIKDEIQDTVEPLPESPSKQPRFTKRASQIIRTFLPAQKKQVLVRYDLFIGLVRQVLNDLQEHLNEI